MELNFCQAVIGSYFDSKEDREKRVCDYGWTSSKGQSSISYSVYKHECSVKECEERKNDMPFVTQEMSTSFSTKQIFDSNDEPTYEPCVLHDFNIGKYGELNMFFHVCENEKFEVTVPIDALKPDELTHIKAGARWFIKMSW